ncbi:LysR family transcriptional regulator [Shinella sp.]|uniref:LysR family transcriptional regulator n=1 Tax=Shinella sp. TaxID=1870904 RepID=UPI0039E25373
MTLISAAALLLDEVARIGSIRKAAERLNISPSSLNRRILNLEAEYGVQLFERLPRGMRLTAAGELLVNDIRRWRTDQERSKVRLQELQGLRRGHVAVGIMECLAGSFASELFDNVQHQYRGMTLEISVGGTMQNIERLVAGQLDMAICFNVPARPEINKLMSLEVPAGIIVGEAHPLASNASVRLSDCLGFPLVLPDLSLATRGLIDRAMAAVSVQPVASAVTNSTRLMKSLVADNRHLAFLSLVDLLDELHQESLRFVPISDGRLPNEELSLIVRNTHHRSPGTAALRKLLETLLRSLSLSFSSFVQTDPRQGSL